MMTTILPSDTPVMRYEESNLSSLTACPFRFDCGIQLLCVSGKSVISTGVEQYDFCETSELIFLAGSLLQVIEASADFKVRILLFPKDVFLKAALFIDTSYFDYMNEVPYFNHAANDANLESWKRVNQWMDMAELLFTHPAKHFREQLEQNFLQSLFIWIFNTIPQKYLSVQSKYSRKQMLYHRFMILIREHSAREHQVDYYANRLCITPRYLNASVTLYSNGRTPKQLIDEQLIAEIKVQLNNPNLSVAEIAQRFNFQEPANLSRFFKKKTGMSPKEFRSMARK